MWSAGPLPLVSASLVADDELDMLLQAATGRAPPPCGPPPPKPASLLSRSPPLFGVSATLTPTAPPRPALLRRPGQASAGPLPRPLRSSLSTAAASSLAALSSIGRPLVSTASVSSLLTTDTGTPAHGTPVRGVHPLPEPTAGSTSSSPTPQRRVNGAVISAALVPSAYTPRHASATAGSGLAGGAPAPSLARSLLLRPGALAVLCQEQWLQQYQLDAVTFTSAVWFCQSKLQELEQNEQSTRSPSRLAVAVAFDALRLCCGAVPDAHALAPARRVLATLVHALLRLVYVDADALLLGDAPLPAGDGRLPGGDAESAQLPTLPQLLAATEWFGALEPLLRRNEFVRSQASLLIDPVQLFRAGRAHRRVALRLQRLWRRATLAAAFRLLLPPARLRHRLGDLLTVGAPLTVAARTRARPTAVLARFVRRRQLERLANAVRDWRRCSARHLSSRLRSEAAAQHATSQRLSAAAPVSGTALVDLEEANRARQLAVTAAAAATVAARAQLHGLLRDLDLSRHALRVHAAVAAALLRPLAAALPSCATVLRTCDDPHLRPLPAIQLLALTSTLPPAPAPGPASLAPPLAHTAGAAPPSKTGTHGRWAWQRLRDQHQSFWLRAARDSTLAAAGGLDFLHFAAGLAALNADSDAQAPLGGPRAVSHPADAPPARGSPDARAELRVSAAHRQPGHAPEGHGQAAERSADAEGESGWLGTTTEQTLMRWCNRHIAMAFRYQGRTVPADAVVRDLAGDLRFVAFRVLLHNAVLHNLVALHYYRTEARKAQPPTMVPAHAERLQAVTSPLVSASPQAESGHSPGAAVPGSQEADAQVQAQADPARGTETETAAEVDVGVPFEYPAALRALARLPDDAPASAITAAVAALFAADARLGCALNVAQRDRWTDREHLALGRALAFVDTATATAITTATAPGSVDGGTPAGVGPDACHGNYAESDSGDNHDEPPELPPAERQQRAQMRSLLRFLSRTPENKVAVALEGFHTALFGARRLEDLAAHARAQVEDTAAAMTRDVTLQLSQEIQAHAYLHAFDEVIPGIPTTYRFRCSPALLADVPGLSEPAGPGSPADPTELTGSAESRSDAASAQQSASRAARELEGVFARFSRRLQAVFFHYARGVRNAVPGLAGGTVPPGAGARRELTMSHARFWRFLRDCRLGIKHSRLIDQIIQQVLSRGRPSSSLAGAGHPGAGHGSGTLVLGDISFFQFHEVLGRLAALKFPGAPAFSSAQLRAFARDVPSAAASAGNTATAATTGSVAVAVKVHVLLTEFVFPNASHSATSSSYLQVLVSEELEAVFARRQAALQQLYARHAPVRGAALTVAGAKQLLRELGLLQGPAAMSQHDIRTLLANIKSDLFLYGGGTPHPDPADGGAPGIHSRPEDRLPDSASAGASSGTRGSSGTSGGGSGSGGGHGKADSEGTSTAGAGAGGGAGEEEEGLSDRAEVSFREFLELLSGVACFAIRSPYLSHADRVEQFLATRLPVPGHGHGHGHGHGQPPPGRHAAPSPSTPTLPPSHRVVR